MARDWQKLDFEHGWAGLVDRRQRLDYGLNIASIAKNIDFFGGSIGRRLGSQYLNGWGTITESGWTTWAGLLVDASGLDTTDTLTFYFANGTSETKAISTIVGNLVTLATALSAAPEGAVPVIARRPLGGGAGTRVDGLFQANFRDGTAKLLAAAGAVLYELPALGAGDGAATVSTQFPVTTVLANWTVTNTGTITSVEGLQVGDKIQIAGRMGANKYMTITGIAPITRAISIYPYASSNPQLGDVVTFYPISIAGDTHFVQHNNVTHIVVDHSVLGLGSAGDTPPVKYYKPSASYVIQRSGIKPPVQGGTAPTATLATSSEATGLGQGDYSWRIKFVNSVTHQESEPGPEITVTGLSASVYHHVNLANLPVSVDPQVTHKRIYRSMALPSGEASGAWYYEGEITNVTTTFHSEMGDTLLGTLMREFLDVCIPDGVSNIILWPQANRLVAVDAEHNTVIFSDQFDVEDGTFKSESWPSDNFILVSYDDGDRVRAVAAFYDSLIVFKERSVFKVSGTPPEISIEPVIFRQDLTSVGTFNAKAVAVDQNEMIFPAADGVYVLSRWEGGEKSFNSARLSREIDNGWSDVNTSKAKRTHAVFFRERRQYRVFIPINLETECQRAYVFQFEGDIQGNPYGWTQWAIERNTVPANITASHVGAGNPDTNYIGTDTGDVICLDNGRADLGGLPIDVDYATGWFTPAGKGAPARGRAVDIAFGLEEDLNIDLSVETDFGSPDFPVSMSASAPTGFHLDVSHLDVDGLATEVKEVRGSVILRALGEYHRIRLREYSATGAFLIQNMTYWFQALPEQAKRRDWIQDRG